LNDPFEVRWIRHTVTWQLPTINGLLAVNLPYIIWLKSELGPETARAVIEGFITESVREIGQFGQPGQLVTRDINLLQVGPGLRFYPFLSPTMTFTEKDPVNLVFYDCATPERLTAILSKRRAPWHESMGWKFFAYIDDSAHGAAQAAWHRPLAQLRKGSFSGRSEHLRLYTGDGLAHTGRVTTPSPVCTRKSCGYSGFRRDMYRSTGIVRAID
jgi:hypothetical protein